MSDSRLTRVLLPILGLALLTTGAAFKIAAVPFHYWTPDAYQGSPTPVTGYLSVGPKVGAFALILRLFVDALGPLRTDWLQVVIVLATVPPFDWKDLIEAPVSVSNTSSPAPIGDKPTPLAIEM